MGYLVGIISIFSALINVELPVIIKEFSLNNEIQNALENTSGTLGEYFTLCISVENNDFKSLEESRRSLKLSESFVMECYVSALTFADESLNSN